MTTVAAVRERAPGERRVAIVPEVVDRLRSAGLAVLVETGAGAAGWFPDDAYRRAGAEVVTAAELRDRADIVACLRPPEWPLRAGQLLVGLLDPLRHPERAAAWAAQKATAISLDLLPRTLPRAQAMDALSSQAAIAGYRAVLLAATHYGRYFPMLTTPAGTTVPASVLVLGTGVAGLAAIGTARRLGAQVTGYDLRPAARGEVESLGAKFLSLTAVEPSEGAGGYARALTDAEQAALRGQLDRQVTRFDVVITSAQVPGRPPPLLITEAGLATMRPGSVVVDLAAGEHGGNVAGVIPDQTVVRGDGVTLIGGGNLPAGMPVGASIAYARNLTALLLQLVRDGEPRIDFDDEILAGVVVTHDGAVVHPAVAARLDQVPTGGVR
ncbi:MAG TPA: NAD(P) transhydrogenase subunit alpha [Natronosporangium sp.]